MLHFELAAAPGYDLSNCLNRHLVHRAAPPLGIMLV
jgi:hypothetical protein